jgi:hypothetical protein
VTEHYALANDYARLIACVRGSTLDDARRVINDIEPSFPDAEALVPAKAWVLTMVAIHGRRTP